MDGNDGGQVLFNEFCRWAMKAHINVDGDEEEEFAQYEEEVAPKPKKKKRDTTPEEVKLLRSLDDKLPTGKTEEEKVQREKMFESADQSGSGQLSLAEIELAVKDFLGEEVFLMKPAIKEAYKAAKGMDPNDDDSFVDKSEFRVLLVALAKYCELWVAFEEIDDGDDHRINFEEFEGALPQIEKWGVKVEDAKAAFDEMDGNDGGQVLFNEFCRWAMKKHIDVDGDEEEEVPAADA